MKKSKTKLNLLEGSILKKLVLLSAPLMATSFVNMAYNMTDAAWLGRLGSDSVAASGSAHFFVWIASALIGISRVGTSIFVAHEYGSNNKNRLKNTIKNGIVLLFLIVLAYSLLINIFAENLIGIYNLNSKVSGLAITYLTIFSYGFIFTGLNMLFSNIYNSLGNSFYPFVANVVGLVINILLDPILIFGFGPILSMSIAGAAYASVFSQFVVLVILLVDIFRTKNEIYEGIFEGVVSFKDLSIKFKKGFPAGLMSITHAIISLTLARYTSFYGTKPMAVASVGAIIESITWMTTEGLQGAIIGFVGQNFGARLHKRLNRVISTSLKIVFGIGVIGTFVLITFRYRLFSLFIPNESDTIVIGASYLLILGMSQLFMAMEIGIAGVLNGLGETKSPAVVSMIFNILRIPMALALMPHYQFYGIWIAMTISSIFKGIFAYIMLIKEKQKVEKYLNNKKRDIEK